MLTNNDLPDLIDHTMGGSRRFIACTVLHALSVSAGARFCKCEEEMGSVCAY